MPRTAADRLRALQGPGQIWSHSALARFESCPYSYLGRYVDQISDPPSGILTQGRLVHAAATLLIRGQEQDPLTAVKTARQDEKEEALVSSSQDATMADWAHQAAAAVPSDASAVIAEEVWVHPVPAASGAAVPSTLNLAEGERALRERVPYAWLRLQDTLRQAGADAVMAGPDLVLMQNQTTLIRDWKTSRPPAEGPEGLVPRYAMQLSLYGSVARRRFPEQRLAFELQVLMADSIVPVPVNQDDMNAGAWRVFTTGQAIKSAARKGRAAFTKNVGEACRYCSLAQGVRDDGTAYCPEGASYRHQQGWDRWDDRNREERRAAGLPWMGDPATVSQRRLFEPA